MAGCWRPIGTNIEPKVGTFISTIGRMAGDTFVIITDSRGRGLQSVLDAKNSTGMRLSVRFYPQGPANKYISHSETVGREGRTHFLEPNLAFASFDIISSF